LKETRKLHIKDKVFNIDDLKKIALIFEEQASLARQNGERSSIEYELHFSDDTTVESEALDILEDDILFSKRPISVQFSYHNYSLNRRISLSLNHGDSSYGNTIIVSGQEREWVNAIFARLTEILKGVTPQESWIKRHPTLLLNVIALGIGTFGCFLIDTIFKFTFANVDLGRHITPPKEGTFLHFLTIVIKSNTLIFYILGWIWRWCLGFFWGAYKVRRWFLNLWPSIELDIGPEHFKIEKQKRKKLYAVAVLVIFPIVTALLYDIIKIFI